MGTTQTVLGITHKNAPHQGGANEILEVAVLVDGTYNTGAVPSFDILAALEAAGRQGVSAVSIATGGVVCAQDGDDGTHRYTAPHQDISLSGTGNKVIAFKIYGGTGAVNGARGSGSELTTDALHHVFTFWVCLTTTPSL